MVIVSCSLESKEPAAASKWSTSDGGAQDGEEEDPKPDSCTSKKSLNPKPQREDHRVRKESRGGKTMADRGMTSQRGT